jgi:predicted Zn-ribbon and HTH transcriptional regulator
LKSPQEQSEKTVRQQIIACLVEADMSAKDISKAVGIREKEVSAHLDHIARTMSARGKALVIRPFQCLTCGYAFKDRKRFTRPGRCPRCKGTPIENPTFRIQ